MESKKVPTEYITVLDEPRLEFRGGNATADPHDGLALFGAFSTLASSQSSLPNHIALGTEVGLKMWERWAFAMNSPAFHENRIKHRLWPPYLGFEVAFGRCWPAKPDRMYIVDREKLLEASRKRDPHERCYAVVDYYLENFSKAKTLDALPGVAICIVPDEVWMNCRPASRIANPSDEGISSRLKKSRRAGQFEIFDEFDQNQYHLASDLGGN